MRNILIGLALLGMAACDEAPAPTAEVTSLPLMGGYRDAADPCQRVGEDDYTNQFLGDASDLVACPAGMENLGVFVTETGAVQVAEAAGHVLFTVARR